MIRRMHSPRDIVDLGRVTKFHDQVIPLRSGHAENMKEVDQPNSEDLYVISFIGIDTPRGGQLHTRSLILKGSPG